jgi:hypothetical protein
MKSLGFVALILSVIGLISPLFAGAFIATLSGGLVIFANKKYNYFGLSALLLNIANLIVFSPQKLLMNMKTDIDPSELMSGFTYFFLFVLLIQVIGIVLYILNTRKSNQIQTK